MTNYIVKALYGAFFVFGLIVSGLLVNHALEKQVETFEQVVAVNRPQQIPVKSELECLAENIYWEAGSESYQGKVAVAQVTINRVGKMANTICGVVHQKTTIVDKVVCQFSWVCDTIRRPIYKQAYKEALSVAKDVLIDGTRIPTLYDALYFHNTTVMPRWKHIEADRIGNHIFYKPSPKSQDL